VGKTLTIRLTAEPAARLAETAKKTWILTGMKGPGDTGFIVVFGNGDSGHHA
jgi:hypothetical protein